MRPFTAFWFIPEAYDLPVEIRLAEPFRRANGGGRLLFANSGAPGSPPSLTFALGAPERMKILVGVLVLAIIGALGVYMYGSAVAERNARFIHVMNDLKQAHMEVQLQGSFTNRFRTSTVQPFTN